MTIGTPADRQIPPLAPIRSLTCMVFEVPTEVPEADGTLAWSKTTVVVVEIESLEERGTGWTYGAAAGRTVIEAVAPPILLGADAFDIPGLHEQLVRACRNFGRPGVVAGALSALDIALWDLKARILGISLSALFGRVRSEAAIYGSGGFTTYDDARAAAELEHFVGELGIPRVKIKIGESFGTAVERDLERVGFVRRVVGDGVEVYVDANGGYTRKQAVRVGRRLIDGPDVTWFEEPVSSDDLIGLREVRDQLAIDVAAGEYGYDEPYFATMVAAEAVDCLQVDVTRCGGYTSFLRAAAIAAAAGLQVSAHCAPNLHLPVALAIPNLRHLEYFRDHERVDAILFDGLPVASRGALAHDSAISGHGMSCRREEAYRVA